MNIERKIMLKLRGSPSIFFPAAAALEFNPSRGIVKWASTDLINVTGFRYRCANVRRGQLAEFELEFSIYLFILCDKCCRIYLLISPVNARRNTNGARQRRTHTQNKQFRGGIDSDWLNNFNIHISQSININYMLCAAMSSIFGFVQLLIVHWGVQ